MERTILSGDFVVIEGLHGRNPDFGDILAIASEKMDIVVHRVVGSFRLRGSGFVVHKGDDALSSRIVGAVKRVARGTKSTRLESRTGDRNIH